MSAPKTRLKTDMATAEARPARAPRKGGVRSSKTSTRTTPSLGKTEITLAALALIDEHGLEAFNMRMLARHLGVYPTAIYWYAESKDAILSAVVSHVLRDVMPAAHSSSWQQWIKQLFRSYRAAIQRHPNVTSLFGAQIASNIGWDYALIDHLLGVLIDAGFEGQLLVRAYNAVFAALLGFVTLEFAKGLSDDGSGLVEKLQTAIEEIDAESLPRLHQYKKRMTNRTFVLRWENGAIRPMTNSFELYVDVIIGGLEKLLASRSDADHSDFS